MVPNRCFFSKQSALKVHHTKAHQSTEPDPKFKCDICGKFLKQQNSYSKHLMNVHKIGLFMLVGSVQG